MAELIVPVDAEQAVIDELESYDDYPVGSSLPDDMPPVFIRVIAVPGGTQRNLVTDVRLLSIEVFAPRETTASQIANLTIARLQLAGQRGRMGDEVCYDVGIGAMPQNFPLPSVPDHKRYISTIAPALRRRVTTL